MIGVPTILRKSNDLRQDWPETLLLLRIYFTAARTSSQYDDIFKLIIENHEEHCKILKTEEQSNDEDYFEDVDQRVFIFKHKVPNWLKDTKDEYDKKSKSSGRSSKGRSSKESTRSSRSSKTSEPWILKCLWYVNKILTLFKAWSLGKQKKSQNPLYFWTCSCTSQKTVCLPQNLLFLQNNIILFKLAVMLKINLRLFKLDSKTSLVCHSAATSTKWQNVKATPTMIFLEDISRKIIRRSFLWSFL